MTTEPTRHANPDAAPRHAPDVDHDTLTEVRDGLRASTTTTVYVVELGHPWAGDIAGALMTEHGDIMFNHVSSSPEHLRADLTERFGRAMKLTSRFGTYTVVYVGLDDEIPAKIAPYVHPAGEDNPDE